MVRPKRLTDRKNLVEESEEDRIKRLAQQENLNLEAVQAMLRTLAPAEPVKESHDPNLVREILFPDRQEDLSMWVGFAEKMAAVNEAKRFLDNNERKLCDILFGSDGKGPRTLHEAAKELRISYEVAMNRWMNAALKLRQALR